MASQGARKLESKTGPEKEPILRSAEEDVVHPTQRARQAPGTPALVAVGVTLAVLTVLAVVAVKGPERQQQLHGVPVQERSLFLAEQKKGEGNLTEQKKSEGNECLDIAGVKLAESADAMSAWPTCSAKWTEDCRDTGCCTDWGMKCYEKSDRWASCKGSCATLDEKNESWTCRELAPPAPRTAESCFGNCAAHKDCQQAVFSSDGGGYCSRSKAQSTKIAWAGDNFHSAYCGSADKKHAAELQTLVDKVNSNLPYELPPLPLQNCSWAGDDCAQTKCCNDVYCDKDFNGCYGYSCYKKTEYFSGCSLEQPPSDWEGTWIGGPREHRTIAPAAARVAVQGTSLYCFIVVAWDAPAPKPFWAAERDLANNIQNKGVSIMQCDAHDFLSGSQTALAAWGSFSNIDAFQQVWQQVKDKGEYKNHDWTVKVDCDAVFIPQRLKWHLDKLRTPKGARVYLENTWYRFKFMGALEILTTQAVDLFLERSSSCLRGDHVGGEDFFMKGCMDALGIDHQSDFELLRDRYAAQDGPCTDGWTVAFHYHKKVGGWNWCWNEAMCGTGEKSCPQGVDL